MGFTVEAIKPHIGARIHTDRDTLLAPGTAEKILELLEDRTVLVFPEIGLSDADQLAFTDTLGPRIYYSSGVPGGKAAEKDVYKLTLDPDVNDEPEFVYANFWWHFDGAQAHVPPPRTTLLTAHKVASKGGQTEFANTYAGYESLPDEEKEEIEDLLAVHSFPYAMEKTVDKVTPELEARWRLAIRQMRGQDPSKEHDDPIERTLPIVWKHRNGRKSLALSTSINEVKGVPLAHGRALVSRVLDWTVQPDFRYRHDWKKGDLLMWNNTAALHRVLPYDYTSGRVMHRTTVAGVEPLDRR